MKKYLITAALCLSATAVIAQGVSLKQYQALSEDARHEIAKKNHEKRHSKHKKLREMSKEERHSFKEERRAKHQAHRAKKAKAIKALVDAETFEEIQKKQEIWHDKRTKHREKFKEMEPKERKEHMGKMKKFKKEQHKKHKAKLQKHWDAANNTQRKDFCTEIETQCSAQFDPGCIHAYDLCLKR